MLWSGPARQVVLSALRTQAQPRILSGSRACGEYEVMGTKDCNEVDRLLWTVECINEKSKELKLDDAWLSTNFLAACAREHCYRSPFPLVAAVNTLLNLDETIRGILPDLHNTVPLETEIESCEYRLDTIKAVVDTLKCDPHWVSQYVAWCNLQK
jgi:hypothetical protein